MSNKLSFYYQFYCQNTEQGPNGPPEVGESPGNFSFPSVAALLSKNQAQYIAGACTESAAHTRPIELIHSVTNIL